MQKVIVTFPVAKYFNTVIRDYKACNHIVEPSMPALVQITDL
jgi:hypothetical protein